VHGYINSFLGFEELTETFQHHIQYVPPELISHRLVQLITFVPIYLSLICGFLLLYYQVRIRNIAVTYTFRLPNSCGSSLFNNFLFLLDFNLFLLLFEVKCRVAVQSCSVSQQLQQGGFDIRLGKSFISRKQSLVEYFMLYNIYNIFVTVSSFGSFSITDI